MLPYEYEYQPKVISLKELDEVLAQARDEEWQELVLFGPDARNFSSHIKARSDRVFQLVEPLAERIARLASLKSLTSLCLAFNKVGDEGAQILAALTNLSSLDLTDNQIGVEGARALAALSKLSFLNLYCNQIGDEGAQALSALTNLSYLDLFYNHIGDEGARALTALDNLTNLSLNNNQIGSVGLRTLLDTWAQAPEVYKLRYLDLQNNRDLDELLPLEVLSTTDAQAILAAYRRHRSAKE